MSPPPVFSESASQNQITKYEELKKQCLGKIVAQHGFLESSESLNISFSDCCFQDETVLQNLKYLEKVVGNHGAIDVQGQVKVKPFQWYLDSDLMLQFLLWPLCLKQCFVFAFRKSSSIQHSRSWPCCWHHVAQSDCCSNHFNTSWANMLFGWGLQHHGHGPSSFNEKYDLSKVGYCCASSYRWCWYCKLFLHTFDGCANPSLIIRMKQHHFVMLTFNEDKAILLDSRQSAPIQLSPLKGMFFLQRES